VIKQRRQILFGRQILFDLRPVALEEFANIHSQQQTAEEF